MITIDSLTLRAKGLAPIDGITMHLAEGAVHALIGPAGAGKTTLLDLLGGVRRPDSGSVTRSGRPLRPREVAYVRQEPRLYEGLTVGDVTELALRYRPAQATDPAALLRSFDLPRDLPLGGRDIVVRRRLALLVALLGDPAVLLLDEPFEGLDAAGLLAARRLILAQRARGTTVVIASRRADTLAGIADDTRLLARGTVAGEYRREEALPGFFGWQGLGGSGKTS